MLWTAPSEILMRTLILPYTYAKVWLVKMLHRSLFQSVATLRLFSFFLLFLLYAVISLNGLLGVESWTSIRVLKSLRDNLSTDIFFVHLKFWLLHPRFDLGDILVQLRYPLLNRRVVVRWLIVEARAVKVNLCRVRNVLTCITQVLLFGIRIYLHFNHSSILL